MNSAQQFLDKQEAELKETKARWKAAAEAFDKAERAGSSNEEQERRLDLWQDAARDFWRSANSIVIDSGHLTGDTFDRWREDQIQTAHNMVSGLLTHQQNVRHHRDRLKIPEQKYEFSPAVFENLQSVLAWYRPADVKLLKAQYMEARLPTGGFDRPRELKKPTMVEEPTLPHATPSGVFTRGILDIAYSTLYIFGVLAVLCVAAGLFTRVGVLSLYFFVCLLASACSLGCIGGGVLAIYKGAKSDTKFTMFGVKLSSQSVGVGFMGIGVIIGYFTITKVLDKAHDASLRIENTEKN